MDLTGIGEFFRNNFPWLLPLIGAVGEGGRRAFRWGVRKVVSDDIQDVGSKVDRMQSEMTRRFDLMDQRLDTVEDNVEEVQETVDSLRSAGADRGERIASLEGSDD